MNIAHVSGGLEVVGVSLGDASNSEGLEVTVLGSAGDSGTRILDVSARNTTFPNDKGAYSFERADSTVGSKALTWAMMAAPSASVTFPTFWKHDNHQLMSEEVEGTDIP